MTFNVEETNLMCCFDTSSRRKLITEMKNLPLNELDEEMEELLFKTVRKLEAMSDAEFDALYIAPDSMMDD
ncbi:transposon-transfer assisting family protein [Oscillibacter sp. ER4]|uniref:transposon-transfer assisting family protein n=1 Tax=Oscillibacter sp. ER4 TaxID=1519439 RepID=UPI00051CAB6D|nr:transposon-transfer assisting family protein [Oscillibacter sp. ER4]MCI6781050.1 transposon-transfer assisting family protein [Dialister sp.]